MTLESNLSSAFQAVGGAPTWAELMPLNPTQAEIDAMPVGSYYATTV